MAARFVHTWWDEEDIHFFFELDDDGYVMRHVEIDGDGQVTSAASLDEWNEARDRGDLHEYRAQWGAVGEGQVLLDRIPPPSYGEPIDEADFEDRWTAARRARADHWAGGGRDEYERTRSSRPVWKPLQG